MEKMFSEIKRNKFAEGGIQIRAKLKLNSGVIPVDLLPFGKG